MADKVITAEEVLKLMKTDLYSYQRFADELIVKALEKDPKLLQSWLDWFNKEGEFPDKIGTQPSDGENS